jgi:hypothetical protein
MPMQADDVASSAHYRRVAADRACGLLSSLLHAQLRTDVRSSVRVAANDARGLGLRAAWWSEGTVAGAFEPRSFVVPAAAARGNHAADSALSSGTRAARVRISARRNPRALKPDAPAKDSRSILIVPALLAHHLPVNRYGLTTLPL